LAALRLVVFLRRRGLSAQEAAEILGVSRATICAGASDCCDPA
jgi:transposase